MLSQEKLTEIVNKSGFPLQIGIANFVRKNSRSLGWQVKYTEHAWKNDLDGSSGFIDIVLENSYEVSVLIIECKRVLESSWIFLVDSHEFKERRQAKLWISEYRSESLINFDWIDFASDPSSYTAGFCVVPGQDSKNIPMLERIAGEVVSSTEAFAQEEKPFLLTNRKNLRIYGSVIVTTADLKVCEYDADKISIDNGILTAAKYHDIPFIRFRKQLSVRTPSQKGIPDIDLHSSALAKAKEQSVFVINSKELEKFLTNWGVSPKDY
jgi:hypothetical protein